MSTHAREIAGAGAAVAVLGVVAVLVPWRAMSCCVLLACPSSIDDPPRIRGLDSAPSEPVKSGGWVVLRSWMSCMMP